MKLVNTTEYFTNYFKDDPQSALDAFSKTKFKCADYSFYKDAREKSVIFADDWKKIFASVRERAEERGIKFVQAHAPGGPSGELLEKATVRSIEICGLLGIPNTVIHSEIYGDVSMEKYFEKSRAFYEKFLPYAERYGVNLLVENSCRPNVGSNTYFINAEEMNSFISYVSHPLLGAVWDAGHGNLADKSQYENITALGKNLKAVHIQDNLGMQDDHMLPLTGTVNFDEVICALRDIRYDGYFTFEASNFLLDSERWPNCRKPFENSKYLENPPLGLNILAADFLWETGRAMLTPYGLFEE